jgi:hypothetical protein
MIAITIISSSSVKPRESLLAPRNIFRNIFRDILRNIFGAVVSFFTSGS